MAADELSIYDKATDQLHELRFKVRARLHEQFKRTKPYRGQPITNDDELYAYNQLTEDEMFRLIQKHGPDMVNDLIMRMETLKQRRGING